MKLPNFQVVYQDAEVIRIRDDGPRDQYPTVTNGAERVIEKLVADGILKPGMRLFYYDSDGEFAEIVLNGLEFAGFNTGVD